MEKALDEAEERFGGVGTLNNSAMWPLHFSAAFAGQGRRK